MAKRIAYMSTIKLERLAKAENKKKIEEMRAALPVLNLEEIRRYKLAPHEALYNEIEEEGFPTAAAYIKQLVDFQEGIRSAQGPDSAMWLKPRLMSCKNELKILQNGLCTAEDAHYEGLYELECEELLRLAIRFTTQPDWLWLGEQLLLQAIDVATDFHFSGGKHEALSKYVYGKLLMESTFGREYARGYLKSVKELSHGMRWSAKKFLPNQENTIYLETCMLLHIYYLEEAKRYLKAKPSLAVELAELSRKNAADACLEEQKVDALLVKGVSNLILNNRVEAIVILHKAFSLKLKCGENDGDDCIYKTYQALTNLKRGNAVKALTFLMEVRQIAESKAIPYYITQVLRYLGEYYLDQGEAQIATPLFTMALNQFYAGCHYDDVDEVRSFAAISTGTEMMSDYIHLIWSACNVDRTGEESLNKLIAWKDSRRAFWPEGVRYTFSENLTYFADMMRESNKDLPFETTLRRDTVNGPQTELFDLNVVSENIGIGSY